MTHKDSLLPQLEQTYLRLPPEFYSRCSGAPFPNPQVMLFNQDLAQSLQIPQAFENTSEAVGLLSGQKLSQAPPALALAYCGHQFGHFTRLGDGRALMLGQLANTDGIRFDLQLKGSGPTPYSRGGDGRAALGPMIREFLVSEFLAKIGIPTTRSLAILTTGETVYRQFEHPGAILARVARSHLRVGTFEYAAQLGKNVTPSLVQFSLDTLYKGASLPESPSDRALFLLEQTVSRQATLAAQWMLLGFIHGALNTDNIALSGESLDFGPCAFMDDFDPDKVFSSIDSRGRYRYLNQPEIIKWNLTRFAESLLSAIHTNFEDARTLALRALARFDSTYTTEYNRLLSQKFGFETPPPLPTLDQLKSLFFKSLSETHSDFILTFRYFHNPERLPDTLKANATFHEFLNLWRQLHQEMQSNPLDVELKINSHSPVFIPRNHWIEKIILEIESGNRSTLDQFLDALNDPFHERDAYSHFYESPKPHERVEATFCGT